MSYIEFIEDDNHPALKPKKNNADDGCRCKECGRLIKRYRRSVNCNMAYALMLLYKSGVRDWVKVETWLINHGHQRCGDFSKLVFFGLLEKKEENRKDGSPRNGYYRLNGRSILFCEEKLKVRKTAVIFNGNFEGFEGKEIGIREALGKNFNYQQLMDGNG